MDTNYVKAQHRFRGLVSSYKSNEFVSGKTQHVPFVLRKGIRELLLETRASLRADQYGDFLNWIELSIQTQIPEFSRIPVGYDALSGVYADAPRVSLDKELRWVTQRLKVLAKPLSEYRSIAMQLEQAVFQGRYDVAVEKLESINGKFGVSFWSIQLRTAIAQQVGGLERQKKYSAEVRGMHKRGLLSFISFYVSVRNEEKTTLDKFVADLRERIDRHRYFDEQIKTYLLFRLAKLAPPNASGYADILRIEQSHSLIDIYETFIAVIQEIIRRDGLRRHRNLASECISNLGDIKDFRLSKAKFLLSEEYLPGDLERRDGRLSSALFSGLVKRAAKISRNVEQSKRYSDPWYWIYQGFCFAHSLRERNIESFRPQDITKLLGQYFSRNERSGESLEKLSKFVVNFGDLVAPVGLSDFLKQIDPDYPVSQVEAWWVGLNSPFFGIEDFTPQNIDKMKLWMDTLSVCGQTEAAWMLFLCDVKSESSSNNEVANLLSAASKIRRGEYQKAIDQIDLYSIDKYLEPIKALAVLLKLHANFALGNRTCVIRQIVEEATYNECYSQLIPIRTSLSSYVWDDYRSTNQFLLPPIALHLLWTKDEASQTASMLRFSVGRALDSSGFELPSELQTNSTDCPVSQLIYFLKEVCVPEFLEQVRAISGTKMLMEERQRVCGVLRQLDPANSDLYQEEIGEISSKQILEEGQWIVDRSRIHVDIEALIRWSSRELSETFDRYRDLLDVDLDAPIDFNQILGELGSSPYFRQNKFVPESESDAVLVPMLDQIREQFINNSSFGLDFYLSKRIRHQSFIGLIRGPVEFAGLITTRETDGSGYNRNEHWLRKFETTSPESLDAIDQAFRRFAETFDISLVEAKDKKFQILSEDKPDGLLFVMLNGPLIFLLREITKHDQSIADFVKTVVEIFWAALEPSLLEVRKYIDEQLKTKITQAFDELRVSVRRRVGLHHPAFLELDHVIGQASSDVQGELDVASQWFTRRGESAEEEISQVFQLEQMLKISIESAKKCHRTFDPHINIDTVEGATKMPVSTLVFLNDVMFVALDNVNSYSGVDKPKISVKATFDGDTGVLQLEVASEVKSPATKEQNENLSRIRELIEQRNFERRTRQEGGSGFLKIAAVVYQRPNGIVKFGFTETKEFQLAVTYSVLSDAISKEVSYGH